ncbi:hypothetical protein ABZX77_30900 [Streptomyces sp. NPDC004237]|uniref:hypothetical protein n=1 Tax=Streptomyces sp. NPDC004237 TaxID=3154455 RepID=UPI0033AAB19E
MTVRSAWLSPDGQSREDTRTNQVGALTPVTDGKGRSGVLPGSAGRAVIRSTLDRGAYPVAVTEQVDLTFAGGDARYGRIDLVVLRVHDDTYDGSGRTEAAVEIVKGTPAAPTAPDVSLVLFSVAVPANASGLTWATDDTAAGGYPGHYRDINSTLQRWDGTADSSAGVLQRWNGSVSSPRPPAPSCCTSARAC